MYRANDISAASSRICAAWWNERRPKGGVHKTPRTGRDMFLPGMTEVGQARGFEMPPIPRMRMWNFSGSPRVSYYPQFASSRRGCISQADLLLVNFVMPILARCWRVAKVTIRCYGEMAVSGQGQDGIAKIDYGKGG